MHYLPATHISHLADTDIGSEELESEAFDLFRAFETLRVHHSVNEKEYIESLKETERVQAFVEGETESE